MKKKGQITIFIIIALVILISFALFWLLKDRLMPEVSPAAIEIPAKFKPIQDYVDYTIQQSLGEAVINLGEHCGLVDPNSYVVTDDVNNPTESIVLKPFLLSKRICPYWYFMSSPNSCDSTCQFNTLMPNLKSDYDDGKLRSPTDFSIEAQIDRYIKKSLAKLDFNGFEFQNFQIKPKAGPIVTTAISASNIIVAVEYPLEVKSDNDKVTINAFTAQMPFDLQRAYKIAAKITSEEKNSKFLESFALSLMSVYSGLDKNKLPPLVRMTEFTDSPIYWQVEDAKNMVRDNVLTKVSSITVAGSKNYNEKSPVSGAVLSFPGEDLSDVEVYFTFPDSRPFYFALNGLQGGSVGPSTSITDLVIYQLKMNDYWIGYDVSFPVLVTMKIPGKKNGETYQFQFALEANIRNSKPLYENETAGTVASVQTMLCDDEQRQSGDITIASKDNYGKTVADVDVFYKCGDTGCFIGKTNSDGLLKTKLPLCVNGIILPSKTDYIGNYNLLTTIKDKSESIRLVISKVKEFSFDAKKLVFEKEQFGLGYNWGYKKITNYQPEARAMESDEELFAIFRRISDDGQAYEVPVDFKGSAMSKSKIMLAPGKYEVTAQLIKNRKLEIPESGGLLGLGKMNATTIESGQYGGLILNQKTSYFELSPDEFEDSDSITLYSIYFDMFSIPKENLEHADLAVINDIESLSTKYRKALEPVVR